MTRQEVVISDQLEQALTTAMKKCEYDRVFILADETTERLCVPAIEKVDGLGSAYHIVIGATDACKTLCSLTHVWEELGKGGGTRHSLLINIGGGMVTDLGGFAASTFKRGISYINIPTTLLAMVDASVGGKTGINFGGLKNEIGVFSNAHTVILDTQFLQTLDRENICSGYAEMLKHGLISGEQMWAELITFDLEQPDLAKLRQMVADSVAVKERIVEEDPTEQGIRKALNLGHTAGHAFESFALRHKPVLHGYAVAWGLICELYLSTVKTGFPSDKMRQTVSFIKEHYGKMTITCDDYPDLFELMTHDKKNTSGIINFTLLGGIGDIRINQTATKEEIFEALDFYREC
ncbi:3-dehydroquinate synthase [Prevotella aff. ruminicola Tc2-24]|uniref:3-dehydroquinate synthase n=1 Tax=Prevotella aff. ruminicola Tc2-24 TaxID=81582 RepID=A0A1I0PLY8_9BACT|nr:3-dehydroquinate synthase [Prevotella aff. ruminicola Tc2-24]SEW15343.1 3-dehydroquinate synthase [Prevotella aff. ruminicola Tc2-24]